MFLGIAADIATLSGEEEERELGGLAAAAVAVLTQNLTSKTYLKGITDFVTALNDPIGSGYIINNMIGSYIPGIVRDLGRHSPVPGASMPWMDEAQRDVRDWTDALLSRIPGMSKDLAPRRNILGEPMETRAGYGPDILSPFAYSKSVDSPILEELSNLDHGFSQPREKIGAVDLTEIRNEKGQDAYDRLLELTGQVERQGEALPAALKRLIESAEYKRLPTHTIDGVTSPRVEAVRKLLSRYRTQAMRQVRSEYTELDAALREQDRQKHLARNPQLQALLNRGR